MRPLAHPSVDDLSLAGILHALSDPVRLDIVLYLSHCGCEVNCVSSAKDLSGLSKSTLSHHFRILREAGLVRSERRGVELLNRLRLEEIERRFPGVIRSILAARASEPRAGCPAAAAARADQAVA
jgi:DNA-binding transcriptional ArsR family regulator